MLPCVAVAGLTAASERCSIFCTPGLSVVQHRPKTSITFPDPLLWWPRQGGSRAVWEPLRFREPLSAGTGCRDAEPSEESFRAQTRKSVSTAGARERTSHFAIPKLDGTFCCGWNPELLTPGDQLGGGTSIRSNIRVQIVASQWPSMDAHSVAASAAGPPSIGRAHELGTV
jgi:hypothetical protein